MKIHVQIPYSAEKTFGKELNEEMARIPDGDAMVILDHDCMFLTPDAISIVQQYAEKYPDALLTSFTNRVGNRKQCLNGLIHGNDSIRHWIAQAERQKRKGFGVTDMGECPSGFLMVVSKKLWNDVGHFTDEKQVLGVDSHFGTKVINKGFKVLIMNQILVWHSYRIVKGKQDKTHLQ